jgi:hypothetical protein
MTPVPGSGSSPRGETAPPITPSEKVQRSGYAMLAVSGLVVATAFGAVAELAGSGFTEASSGPPPAQGTAPSGGSQLIPGNGVPGTGTMTITGVAEAGTLPSSSAPTTVVTIGPDGTPTTTVLPPPPVPPGTPGQPGTSGRSDLPSDTTPGGPGPQAPAESSSEPPTESSSETPPESSSERPSETEPSEPETSQSSPPEDSPPPASGPPSGGDTTSSTSDSTEPS